MVNPETFSKNTLLLYFLISHPLQATSSLKTKKDMTFVWTLLFKPVQEVIDIKRLRIFMNFKFVSWKWCFSIVNLEHVLTHSSRRIWQWKVSGMIAKSYQLSENLSSRGRLCRREGEAEEKEDEWRLFPFFSCRKQSRPSQPFCHTSQRKEEGSCFPCGQDLWGDTWLPASLQIQMWMTSHGWDYKDHRYGDREWRKQYYCWIHYWSVRNGRRLRLQQHFSSSSSSKEAMQTSGSWVWVLWHPVCPREWKGMED